MVTNVIFVTLFRSAGQRLRQMDSFCSGDLRLNPANDFESVICLNRIDTRDDNSAIESFFVQILLCLKG